MNNLCAEVGYKSINHDGEQLCGDHVDIVEQGDNSTVVVLADGLGSGVKASILSTLTSKIISTMMSEDMKLEDCVSTIAATLPICSVRGVAYSTFTIIHLIENETVEIIQYDNPNVIFIRGDSVYDYPKQELNIDGKKVLKSVIKLQEGDCIVAMSDGCPHAGIGIAFNLAGSGKISRILCGLSMRPGIPPRRLQPCLWTSATSSIGISRETMPPHVWSKYDDGSR